MKSRSSASKRFKVAAGGKKIKRGSAFRSHLNTIQTGQQMMNKSHTKYVAKADHRNILRMVEV